MFQPSFSPQGYAVDGDRLLVADASGHSEKTQLALLDLSEGTWLPIPLDPKQTPRSGVSVEWLGVDLFWGGGFKDERAFNDLWHYSFRTGEWDRVDVPEWVDVLEGTRIGDRLAFTGRCPGGTLFDPSSGTWTPMSTEGSAHELGASGLVWAGVAGRVVEFLVESEAREYEGPFVFPP